MRAMPEVTQVVRTGTGPTSLQWRGHPRDHESVVHRCWAHPAAWGMMVVLGTTLKQQRVRSKRFPIACVRSKRFPIASTMPHQRLGSRAAPAGVTRSACIWRMLIMGQRLLEGYSLERPFLRLKSSPFVVVVCQRRISPTNVWFSV
jgi:hypothetical protein